MSFATGELKKLRRALQQFDMEAAIENPAEEVKRHQRCINDLVSILALPAVWIGGEPSKIVSTLLDTLVSMLDLDFAYVRLVDAVGKAPIELVRVDQSRMRPTEPQEISEMLNRWFQDDPGKLPPAMRKPFGDGSISIVPCRLGLRDEIGLVVVGSERADFPRQTELLLLSVASNQAAIGLQESWLRNAQKRIANELDQRVAQRTTELAAANDELKKEVAERRLAETKLRQEEKDLKVSEARKAAILNSALDCIVTIDHEGCINEFNLAAERTFGYCRAQVMGKPLADVIIPPSLRERHRQGFARYLATGEEQVLGRRIEITAVRQDGSEFPVELAITRIPMGGPPSFTGYLRDITKRKRREEALRRSAAYLAEAQKLSLTGSFGLNLSSGELIWSDETFSILGCDRSTKPSLEVVLSRVHPDDVSLVKQTLDHATRDGTNLDFQHRLLLPDGTIKHVRVLGHVLGDDRSGKEIVGAVMDITSHYRSTMELEKAFSELKQSEESFRLIVDNMPGLVCSMSAAGEVEIVNQRVLDYTGRSLEEMRNWASILHPDDLGRVNSLWSRCVETGCPFDIESRILNAGGVYRWFRVRGLAMRNMDGAVVRWYVSLNDVDDRKTAEAALNAAREELAHVTRLTTIGELTASIAHEVNQPLGAVVANANACLRWLNQQPPKLDEAQESVRQIILDGNRGSDVVTGIRKLLRKEQPHSAPLKLNEVVQEIVALLRVELGEVLPQTQLADDLPRVVVDRVQLQQVLLNLIMNAIEAMKSVSDRPRVLRIETNRDAGRLILIAVRDSGPGLNAEQMQKLFEPFYTTKPQGLGMGLSICRSIVERYGGRLWAEPNEDGGATFKFTLPCEEAAST